MEDVLCITLLSSVIVLLKKHTLVSTVMKIQNLERTSNSDTVGLLHPHEALSGWSLSCNKKDLPGRWELAKTRALVECTDYRRLLCNTLSFQKHNVTG